jgi:hypothetical protein
MRRAGQSSIPPVLAEERKQTFEGLPGLLRRDELELEGEEVAHTSAYDRFLISG